MDTFTISDAVTLYSQESSNVTTLWAFYTAAAFAAAGFGVGRKSRIPEGLVVTLGFWTFTLGHLELLRFALWTRIKLSAEIQAALKVHGGDFRNSLADLVVTTRSLDISSGAHLVVDCCATLAMWSRILKIGSSQAKSEPG